jgi:uncharacterized protein
LLTSTDRLLLFTRYPTAGKTKTRLIPALGAEGAALLQRQMTEHTLGQIRQLMARYACSVEIWFAVADDRPLMQEWLGTDWQYLAQTEGDLGTRLAHAFAMAFATGGQRVVAIGTDCPDLDADRMVQAFQMLQIHDLVLGPATDGGYYLIGLRQPSPALFAGVDWGTDRVFQQTIAIAEQLGQTIARLEPLSDVDRPADLPIWAAVKSTPQASSQLPRPRISVIIPTLNEGRLVQKALKSARQNGVEVIVVDGRSRDDTAAVAIDLGATVITTDPGRARQMNAGAAIATGEILLFLHADTCLPENFVALVEQTLSQAIAGAFELKIDAELPGLRWVEWGVKWRSRLFRLPYGDQAIFLKAVTFRALGGFADLPIMEDFNFIRRLRSLGRVAIVPAAVLTSGRRWQKLGILQTTLRNQQVILAYFLGIDREKIARWYRDKHPKNRD